MYNVHAVNAQTTPRITVAGSLYHQQPGQGPTQIDLGFSRWLKSDEQLWHRQGTATESWRPVDLGWCEDDLGMLVIRNQAGQFRLVNPTEEEAGATAAAVLEMKYDGAPDWQCWLIPPGEIVRMVPGDARLVLRCRSGTARYSLYAIPR